MSSREPDGTGRLPGGVRRLLRMGDAQRDVSEELADHFDRTLDELMSAGMTRADAEAEARRRFGDPARYRQELERIDRSMTLRRRLVSLLDTMWQSVSYAARSLIRAPALSLGVILAFALGIGANVTMYGIVERLLLRPPDYIADADDVKRIYAEEYVDWMNERFATSTLTYPQYRMLREVSAFEDVAAFSSNRVTTGSGMDATQQQAVLVTGNWFDLLGVQPALGRFFTAGEDVIGGAQQVVLGYGTWQRDFGGTRDVIGRTIDFGYGPYQIIGVAPEGFTGVDLAEVDLWLPFHVLSAQTSGTEWVEDNTWSFFEAVARLRPAASVTAATEEASALFAAMPADRSPAPAGDPGPEIVLSSVLSAHGPEAPPESMVARVLLIVSAIVLLIASLNVANLLLARSIRQRREIAVRLALGISRRRLIGQIVLEGMLLAVVGGAAALLLAQWGGTALGNVLLPGIVWDSGISMRVLMLTTALSLLAGAAAGLVPALQATRGGVAHTLRQAGAGAITRRTARVRTGLALVQTTLSVLLLIGAGLFVRSLDEVTNEDLGFEPDNLVYAVPVSVRGALDDEAERVMFAHGREQLARVPGVRAAGYSMAFPFYASRSIRLSAEGHDSIPRPATGGPYLYEVSVGYLEAMDIAVLEGRAFTQQDIGGAPVAIVNRTMATAMWPGASPLGRCLYLRPNGLEGPPPCTTIVGVVENSRHLSLDREPVFQYFVPIEQRHLAGTTPSLFAIRVSAETPAIMQSIRRAVLDLDSRLRWVRVETMSERIDHELRSWQLGATVFGAFGLLALIVAGIGLYSVLAFDVAQRTREIGIRTALGASAPRLLSMIVGSALRLTAIGVLIGIVLALALVSRIEPMLYGVPARDPITFAVVVSTLLVVAAIASGLPGWKASSVDPNVALRTE